MYNACLPACAFRHAGFYLFVSVTYMVSHSPTAPLLFNTLSLSAVPMGYREEKDAILVSSPPRVVEERSSQFCITHVYQKGNVLKFCNLKGQKAGVVPSMCMEFRLDADDDG